MLSVIKNTLIAAIVLLLTAAGSNAQTDRVSEARKLLEQTNTKIAIAEKEAPYTDVFVVELAVNKAGTSYPAVGTYSSTAKFYYTFGDREKDPYPHRLLKIEVVTKRSAEITSADLLYNDAGLLVYGSVKTDGLEQRDTQMYFDREKLIAMTDDGKEVNVRLRSVIETAAALKRESTRLVAMFRSALKEGF